MKIKTITDQNFQKYWDDFVIKNSLPADFLQSWSWGEFRQKKLAEKILRLAVYSNNPTDVDEDGAQEIIAVAQFIYQDLPLDKHFLFCPRGPVINNQLTDSQKQEILNLLIQEIKTKEKVVFVRLELPYKNFQFPIPSTRDNFPARIALQSMAGRQINSKFQIPKILTKSINPQNTLLLDLTKSEEEILSGMHPKWRYNIRLAEKRGIEIKFMNYDLKFKNNNVNEFYKLLQETAKRDGIKIFNKKYYEDLINYFNQLQITDYKLQITLLFAEYNNKPLAAIILLGFGDTLTYLHGGSSNEHRDLMPNHAIQWAAIKWAKKNGYRWYDFWGINKTSKNNTWAGITRFKQGFINEKNGQEINYVGAKDLVINKMWYNLYRMGKLIQF